MISILTFCALVGFSFSASVDFRPYNHTAALLYEVSDLDLDGYFSRQELDEVFKKYDTNNDGRVTRCEYLDYATADIPYLVDFSNVLYDDYDMDGDHHLDKHDYDEYYRKMDTDGSGLVVEKEFMDYWIALFIRTEGLHSVDPGTPVV